MAILPKLIYSFNIIQIKIPAPFFLKKFNIFLKIYMEMKGTQNSQSSIEKKGLTTCIV